VSLGSTSGETWIGGTGTGPCADVVSTACAMAGFTPDVRHRVDDWSAAMALVAAGAGVALVPRLALPYRPRGILARPLPNSGAGRMIYAAVRAGTQHSPTLRAVLDLLGATAASVDGRGAGERNAPVELVTTPAGDHLAEGAG
jgi:DNA-binding transcriptional LysR family regulator